MTTLKLTKSIDTHNGVVSELNFREPTGSDLRKLGMPFELEPSTHVDGNPTIRLNEPVALRWVGELSELDEGVLDQCHVADLFSAMWKVVEMVSPAGK